MDKSGGHFSGLFPKGFRGLKNMRGPPAFSVFSPLLLELVVGVPPSAILLGILLVRTLRFFPQGPGTIPGQVNEDPMSQVACFTYKN